MTTFLKLLAVLLLVWTLRDSFAYNFALLQREGKDDPRVSAAVAFVLIAAIVWAVWYLGARI